MPIAANAHGFLIVCCKSVAILSILLRLKFDTGRSLLQFEFCQLDLCVETRSNVKSHAYRTRKLLDLKRVPERHLPYFVT